MPQKVDSILTKLFQLGSGALCNQPERRGIKVPQVGLGGK